MPCGEGLSWRSDWSRWSPHFGRLWCSATVYPSSIGENRHPRGIRRLLNTTPAVEDGSVGTRFLRRHQMVVLGAIGRRGMGPRERPSMIRYLAGAPGAPSQEAEFAWALLVAVRISFSY
jgi:hypothetical protein